MQPASPRIRQITFQSGDYKLNGTLHLPERPATPPIVIGCHGLLSDGNSPKQIALAAQCNTAGIGYFRFDHRGCGKSTGDFEHVTSLPGRSDDVLSAIQKLTAIGLGTQHVGLFGSSFGGAVCLDVASRHTIDVLVVFAAPVAIEVAAPATFPPNLSYDLSGKLGRVGNVHIFHGESDTTVPISHAHAIYRQVAGPKQLTVQKNGDHRMSDPAHQAAFLDSAVHWFERALVGTRTLPPSAP